MIEKPVALQKLAHCVRESGYKALVTDDAYITSSMSGFTVIIFCNPESDNIQFYSGFSNQVEKGFTIAHANAFNDAWRYTKCLVRDTGAVAFEADFLISMERDGALEFVSRAIEIWETTLVAGAKALSGDL